MLCFIKDDVCIIRAIVEVNRNDKLNIDKD